jgi:hypothetical protein
VPLCCFCKDAASMASSEDQSPFQSYLKEEQEKMMCFKESEEESTRVRSIYIHIYIFSLACDSFLTRTSIAAGWCFHRSRSAVGTPSSLRARFLQWTAFPWLARTKPGTCPGWRHHCRLGSLPTSRGPPKGEATPPCRCAPSPG